MITNKQTRPLDNDPEITLIGEPIIHYNELVPPPANETEEWRIKNKQFRSILNLNKSVLTDPTKSKHYLNDLKNKIINYDKHIRDTEDNVNGLTMRILHDNISLETLYKHLNENKVIYDISRDITSTEDDYTVNENIYSHLYNLLLIRPFILFDVDYTYDNLINLKDRSKSTTLHKTLAYNRESIIRTLYEREVLEVKKTGRIGREYESFKSLVSIQYQNVIGDLERYGLILGGLVGPSINVVEIMDMYAVDDNVRKFIDNPVPELAHIQSVKEQHTLIHQRNEDFTHYLTTYFPDYGISILLEPKSGAKSVEIGQSMTMLGYRPNMDGFLYNIPILGNYYKGLPFSDVRNINASIGKKSLVYNKKYIAHAGTTQRQFVLLCGNHKTYAGFCGTVNPIKTRFTDRKDLLLNLGRNFEMYDENGELSEFMLPPYEDTIEKGHWDHLIGHPNLYMFSPITCNHTDGVCSKCLGHSYLIKRVKLPFYALIALVSRIGNSLLGVKHLIKTNGLNYVKLPEHDDSYLNFLIEPTDDENIFFKKNVKRLFISPSDVQFSSNIPYVKKFKLEYENHNGEMKLQEFVINNFYCRYHFSTIIDKNRSGGTNGSDYVWDLEEMTSIYNKKNGTNHDIIPTFYVQSFNPEIVHTLKNFLADIHRSQKDISVEDYYHVLYNKIKGNIDFRSEQLEILISNLVVRSDINMRPDFTKKQNEKSVKFLSIKTAIMTGPLSSSMSFENYPAQLSNILILLKKKTGSLDYMYKNRTSDMYDLYMDAYMFTENRFKEVRFSK